MGMGQIAAPEWYVKARSGGISKEDLLDKITEECLNALKRRAARQGKPEPREVQPEVVTMTADMYEFAFSRAGNDE
jgi:hypothetical protein